MKTTIGDFISRIRREIKAVKQDAFLSDRFLYALTLKHAPWLMKREDSSNKLLRHNSIIEVLPYVELIESDKSEASCMGVYSGCTFKRSKNPLPELFDGYSGALFRAVTSLDGSEELQQTEPSIFLAISRQTSFRFNKFKYFWFLNQHLYFPDLEWDAVRVEGIFKGDVTHYSCDACGVCRQRQKQALNIPGYLLAELESYVLKDLRDMMGIPPDENQDKQALTR
jgi:hypothetical protein